MNTCLTGIATFATSIKTIDLKTLLFATVVFLAFVKCNGKKEANPITENDTTRLFTFTLKTAYDAMRMPSIYDTQQRFLFGDTVLLTADTSLMKYLPKSIKRRLFILNDTLIASNDSLLIKTIPQTSDTIHFKILEEKDIACLIAANKENMTTPNYLKLGIYNKTDSGYVVVLASLSGVDYGGGGQMSLNVTNRNDSFIINRIGFASIN